MTRRVYRRLNLPGRLALVVSLKLRKRFRVAVWIEDR